MNTLKIFRKPYTGIFLSCLILFISCQQSDYNHSEQVTFEKFIESHIEITSEMYDIISKETSMINSSEDLGMNEQISFDSFNNFFKLANVKEHEKLAKLSMEMHNNVGQFLESHPNFSNLDEKQINLMIEKEVTFQASTNKSFNLSKSQLGFCEEERDIARQNCQIAYGVSMAAAAVSCWFTFGVGCVAGTIAIQALAIACESNVINAYNRCLENQNS